MMRVFYEGPLGRKELYPDEPLMVLPSLAELVLETEDQERPEAILLNGVLQHEDERRFPCSPSGELTLLWGELRQSYIVRPLVRPWAPESSELYRRFLSDHARSREEGEGELERILQGSISLYAEDAWVEVRDWTPLLNQLETALPSLRRICTHPRSYLELEEEIRPVEAVKRIDWQAIPYLMAHSEDWKSRTAAGLRPARLLAQVEQERLDLYENRLACTLIDQVLRLLFRQQTWLETQYAQLTGMMSSTVQTGSFGFDLSFQLAVEELLAAGRETDSRRSAALNQVTRLKERSAALHRRYQALRHSPLYRALEGAKPVQGPLYETNLLLMDPHYQKVRKLWNALQKVRRTERTQREEDSLDFPQLYEQQLLFCQALWGFTAHVLHFEPVEEGLWRRQGDQLELRIFQERGLLHLILRDAAPRSMLVPPEVTLPLEAGESYASFSYDGTRLFWKPGIQETEIQKLCSRLQSKESRGREQAEEKRRYRALKSLLDEAIRKSPPPQCRELLLWPALIEPERSKQRALTQGLFQAAQDLSLPLLAAFPQCEEGVQAITDYGLGPDNGPRLLPLSLYDINSYRRLQKLLLRAIVSLGQEHCPACGGPVRRQGEQLICDECCGLQMTSTVCPYCGSAYRYLHDPLSEETLAAMEAIPSQQFFQRDSLYRYRDVVPMQIEGGRLHSVCPFCGR